MTPAIKSIRASFKRAGFPLTAQSPRGARCWAYLSSVVNVRLVRNWMDDGQEIRVWTKWHGGQEFQTAKPALAYVRRVLSIQVAASTEYTLRTEPRGSLRLVGAA